jgi:hypothetical protein
MTKLEEVKSFAREYINHPQYRTPARKEKIKVVLENLTGKKLDNSCGTCYIEAIFTILKFSPMASSKYALKKGVVLTAFGHPEKTCTNNTITDELGDWYMANFPEKVIFFERLPQKVNSLPAGIEIINPDDLVSATEQVIIPKQKKRKPQIPI